MVPVGPLPILLNVMEYYSYFGHSDFILCLGWKANLIKEYFFKHEECVFSDRNTPSDGSTIDQIRFKDAGWNITLADTGLNASIGERLKAVQQYVENEEIFLANYTDGLSNIHLPLLINLLEEKNATAAFVSIKPQQTFHLVSASHGLVWDINRADAIDLWVNGGFFVFRNSIFDYIRDGEDLVDKPFERLIKENRLCTIKYNGFWNCMDTFKEKQILDDLYASGVRPWEVWEKTEPKD